MKMKKIGLMIWFFISVALILVLPNNSFAASTIKVGNTELTEGYYKVNENNLVSSDENNYNLYFDETNSKLILNNFEIDSNIIIEEINLIMELIGKNEINGKINSNSNLNIEGEGELLITFTAENDRDFSQALYVKEDLSIKNVNLSVHVNTNNDAIECEGNCFIENAKINCSSKIDELNFNYRIRCN